MELLDDKYQIEQLLGEGGIVIHPQLSRHDQFVTGQSKPGGESLRDASDQFDALDIPRSKWQARMKSRLTTHHTPR